MADHMTPPAMPAYPARLEIDYPEEGLDRASTAFRLVLALPIGVIVALLTTSAPGWTLEDAGVGSEIWAALLTAAGFVFLPALLMISCRLGSRPSRLVDAGAERSRIEKQTGRVGPLAAPAIRSTRQTDPV